MHIDERKGEKKKHHHQQQQMILTTYAHFVSFFRNFSHFSLGLRIFFSFFFSIYTNTFISCYLRNLYRHAHSGPNERSIYRGANERTSQQIKKQHYIEKKTNDAASLYKLSIVGSLSDCCPIIYRIF